MWFIMTFFSWTSRWSWTWQSIRQKLWINHSFFDEIACHGKSLLKRWMHHQSKLQIDEPITNRFKHNYPRKVFVIFIKWSRKIDSVHWTDFLFMLEKNRWKAPKVHRIPRLIFYFEALLYSWYIPKILLLWLISK